MNCGEAREYLFAFLDNELDGPRSIELQRHLDGCAACAREAEIERVIGKRLRASMQRDEPALLPVETTVSQVVAGHDGLGVKPAPTRGRAGWVRQRLGAVAVVVGLALVALWWGVGRDGAPGDVEATLTDLLVADFAHFLEEGKQVQLASADARTVSRWLREKTQLPVEVPGFSDGNCRLVGARKCKIAGKPAAFAVYDMHGVPASLVVLNAEPVALGPMRRVEQDGRTHWVDHREGVTVVACPRDRLVYAAVSTLTERELLCLMEVDGRHEGD